MYGDTSAFTNDPGYQFSLDQALESVRNRGAAGGNFGGGGTTSDLLRVATGLAAAGRDCAAAPTGPASSSTRPIRSAAGCSFRIMPCPLEVDNDARASSDTACS